MTKKTLGQVAFEAYQGSSGYAFDRGDWLSMGEDWRAVWEDVAESVKNEVSAPTVSIEDITKRRYNILPRTSLSCAQCDNPDLKGIHTCGR
jgi:hypothetical protein